MAETHVLSALKARREEIASEIRTLVAAVSHLDATIKLFEGGKPPKPKQRQLSRAVFDVLREADRPMTSKELAEQINAPIKRVMGTLCYQRDRGRVKGVQERGNEILWELTR